MTYHSVNIGVHIVEFRAYGTLITGTKEMITTNEETYKLYPNPVVLGNEINLEVKSEKQKSISIEFYNLNGNKILGESRFLNTGINFIQIPTAKLSRGIFPIHIIEGEKRVISKVVIK